MTPGWTTATRFSWSISRIRSIAVKAIVRPPSIPAAPPDRPGPGAARDDRDAELARRSGPARRPRPSSSGRRPRGAGRHGGRASRRCGTTRDRSARSGAASPGRRAAIAATSGSSGPAVSAAAAGRVEAMGSWVVTAEVYRGRRSPSSERGCAPGYRIDRIGSRRARRSCSAAGRCRSTRRSAPSPSRRSPVPRRRRRRPTSCRAPSSDRARCSTRPTTPTSGSSWGTRKIYGRLDGDRSATRRAAPIDRVELNTIAARLGGMPARPPVTVDGRAVAADASATRRSSCRSAGSCQPAARRTSGSAIGATLRSSADRLELAVHPGQRRRRPLPLAAVGQPADRRSTGRTTATRSRRRRAGRSGSGSSPPQKLVLATTGDRVSVSADGLTQTFAATERPRLHGDRGDRLHDEVAGRPRHDRPRLLPAGRAGGGDARCRGGRLRRARAPARLLPASDVPGRPVRRRLRDGVARPHLDPARHRRVPTCATSPRTRRPTSGSTGSSATTRRRQPVRRRGRRRFRRPLRPRPPARAAAAPTATLDRSIYEYSAACYYEKIYIQGGNLLDDARQAGWARPRSGRPCAATWRPTGTGSSTTATLLHALDAGTSLDLGRTLFGPRFPRIY